MLDYSDIDLDRYIYNGGDLSFFLFEANEFIDNFKCLKDALDKYYPKYLLSYSYKTNSLKALIKLVKDMGIMAEVVSEDEYNLAKSIGNEINNIIYNGPIKTRNSFYEAITNGAIVNIDSKREVLWLRDLLNERKEQIRKSAETKQFSDFEDVYSKKIKVGIRLNFDLLNDYEGASTSVGRDPRFGFSDKSGELAKLIKYLKSEDLLEINTLHLHHSNHTRDSKFYTYLIEEANKIIEKYSLNIENIDLGGSFFAGGKFKYKFLSYIKDIADTIQKYDKLKDIRLILEPGASVVASAFSLVSIVLDKKNVSSDRYLLTDASRCLIDPFMHKNRYDYRIIPRGLFSTLNKDKLDLIREFCKIKEDDILTEVNKREVLPLQYISGYTCMENDVIMKLENVAELMVGDIIIYDCVGSYTMCFNPQFIRYTPEVYEIANQDIKLVRRKFEVKDYSSCDID